MWRKLLRGQAVEEGVVSDPLLGESPRLFARKPPKKNKRLGLTNFYLKFRIDCGR
jgi:hypothetical protein